MNSMLCACHGLYVPHSDEGRACARACGRGRHELSLPAPATMAINTPRGGTETRSRRGGRPRLALGLFGRPVLGLPLLLQLAHALLERHEALDEGGHLVRHRVVHHARA